MVDLARWAPATADTLLARVKCPVEAEGSVDPEW